MKVGILIFDGVFDTGLSVFLDVLSTANEVAAMEGNPQAFEVRLTGMRPQVRSAMGLTTSVEPPDSLGRPAWIVAPAINAKQPQHLVAELQRPDIREGVSRLCAWHGEGINIAAACIGTFLLGEAGILAGREATTTWSLSPLFRQRYPDVLLDENRMIVPAGSIVTAGAAIGHLDLALWLVRQKSPELAAVVARLLLIDRRPSQAPYMIPDFLANADPLIERFERWARNHLTAGFSLQAAASALSVSPRTLQRRTESVLGKSPLAFFQDMRVAHARHLIAIGHRIDDVAGRVGYADSATLRSLLRRKLGRGVRDLRVDP